MTESIHDGERYIYSKKKKQRVPQKGNEEIKNKTGEFFIFTFTNGFW